MSVLKRNNKRIPQYDLMRAAAMFLVVYVHSSFMFNFTLSTDSNQAGLYWFTSVLALACNALFFMVSGKFNLVQGARLEVEGYRIFYIKKVIDLLLPVAVYAVAFWVLRFVGMKVFGAWDDGVGFWDLRAFLGTVHQLLMSSWWFVPMIFSLMIFTPFLGRMIDGLKIKEVYLLLGAVFGCAAIVAIEVLLGFTTVFSTFFKVMFGIWAAIYVLGYVIDLIEVSTKALSRWYMLAGALVTLFGFVFVLFPEISLSTDGTPAPGWNGLLSAVFYPVIAGALFLYVKNITISSERLRRAVEFLGNRAFGIYLIHFCFFFSYLHLLPDWLRSSDNAVGGIAKRIVITLIVYFASLIVATLIDLLVVAPAQKRLKTVLLKA
jgi:surface polysaccharide O-acyltransferase-like enzyme